MSKLQFMQRAASLPGPETNAPAAAAATSAVQPPPAPPQLELQIVAMSATLPNLEEVAGWMDATLFHTDFRPVALQDSYKLGDNLYDPRGRLLRQLPPCAQTGRGPQQDPDRVVTLVEEACLKGDQVGWWMCCAVLCCTLRGSLISDNPSIVTFCSPSTHPTPHAGAGLLPLPQALRVLRPPPLRPHAPRPPPAHARLWRRHPRG